jgi:cell wall assembly regulator SMI1
MKHELKTEIERLKLILESNGLEFIRTEGASADNLAVIESQIGFTLDENLKALWQFSNGSNDDFWFTVFSDEKTPCIFPSIEEAFEHWSLFVPYDDSVYEEFRLLEGESDERIQPNLVHVLRFPFAEFNGYSTSVLFDADPAGKGSYGQIIVYQHDPDGIYYVANNFLEFFKKSNNTLEVNLKDIFL